jgi:hypothetical protein
VQLVTSIAQGLGLCPDERDHLLRLSGHNPPARGAGQSLLDPDQSHRLLVFAAVPDSESDKKLQQLSVIASRTSG